MAVCTKCGKSYSLWNAAIGEKCCWDCYCQSLQASLAIEQEQRQARHAADRTKSLQNRVATQQAEQATAADRAKDAAQRPQIRYAALRRISNFYRVVAWVCGIGTAINVVSSLVLKAFETSVAYLVIGLCGTIGCIAIAEMIIVFLDIEENTRNSYAMLWRQQQSNGPLDPSIDSERR